MNLAQSAWESGDARRTLELLRHWASKPGEEDLRGFEWHYWNRQAHQERRTVRLEGLTPRDRATGLLGTVSRDGNRVAGAVNDLARYTATIRVWDATSGHVLWQAPPIPGFLESCSFSENGERLLTTSFIQGAVPSVEARVWDVKDRTLLHTSAPLAEMRQLVTFFSSDGERLVTDVREGQVNANRNASRLKAIRLVRVSDGKELARMSIDRQSDTTWVSLLGGSPDLANVLLHSPNPSDSVKHQLRLHDIESGQSAGPWTLARAIRLARHISSRVGSDWSFRSPVSTGGNGNHV